MDALTVLSYAALPVTGTLVGFLVGNLVRPRPSTISFALHGAAGVIVAVIAVELMPRLLGQGQDWWTLGFFLGGGVLIFLLDLWSDHIATRHLKSTRAVHVVPIIIVTSIDLLSDGILIGAGSVQGGSLGFLLALGQVPADVPEGIAVAVVLKEQKTRLGKRLLAFLPFPASIVGGTLLAYFLLRGIAAIWTTAALALAAGALFTVVAEEIIPQAHRAEHPNAAALLFLLGFGLFAATSFLFG